MNKNDFTLTQWSRWFVPLMRCIFYDIIIWILLVFFFRFSVLAGRSSPRILWTADAGNRKLPRSTGHGRVLRQRRFVLCRRTAATVAVVNGQAIGTVAMRGRTAVQHPVPIVLARVSKPGRGVCDGSGGGQRPDERRRRRLDGVHGGIQSSTTLRVHAPLFFRKRHHPRVGWQLVHDGWRRHSFVRLHSSFGQQQPRHCRRKSSLALLFQLDRKYTILFWYIYFFFYKIFILFVNSKT